MRQLVSLHVQTCHEINEELCGGGQVVPQSRRAGLCRRAEQPRRDVRQRRAAGLCAGRRLVP
jgi:hypothetical protein